MGKFNKGVLFGGVLGAGLMWMSTTKKGREVKEQLLEQAAEVYAEVKEQLVNSKKIKELSQHEYIKKVQEVVDMYAVKNGLAERVKSLLVKVVSAQWKNIQKEMKK